MVDSFLSYKIVSLYLKSIWDIRANRDQPTTGGDEIRTSPKCAPGGRLVCEESDMHCAQSSF